MTDMVYSDIDSPYRSRVQWGAIIAGVIIAMVTQVLLGLLGLAIGLTALDPIQNEDLSGYGVGSGIWLIISTLISVFAGAWAASWLSNAPVRMEGILHGVLTWGLFMVITLFLVGSGIGNIIGGAFNIVSSSFSGTADDLTARPTQAEQIAGRLDELMPTSGPASERLSNITPEQVKVEISQRIAAGDEAGAVILIRQHTGLSQTESEQLVEDSQVETREVAQQVSDTGARVAWFAFFAGILSLLAGSLGGGVGYRTRSHERYNV